VLKVPSYEDSQGRFATPIADVYAWIGGITLSFLGAPEVVTVVVSPDRASADAALKPLDTFSVIGGAEVAPGVRFPAVADLTATDPQFAAAFDYIKQTLYRELAKHPRLARAEEVA
jgi:hypothetical protein